MSPSPDDLIRGRELIITDDIRYGDLLRFEREDDSTVQLGTLGVKDLMSPPRDVFRIFPSAEGLTLSPANEPLEELRAWERVREKAHAAKAKDRDWLRFGIPLQDVEVFAPGQSLPTKRVLSEIDMPDEVREEIEILLSIGKEAPPIPEPVRALVGLRIELSEAPEDLASWTRERFPDGAIIQLTGLRSCSPTPAPPLFAAGATGIMLDLMVHEADSEC